MRNLYNIICLTLLMLTLFSCQDWLDVKPKTEIDSEELFSTEEGFKSALSGVYTLMAHQGLYGREMTYGVVDAAAQWWKVAEHHTYVDVINGAYESTKVQPIIDSIWIKMYNAIANANSIIGNIDSKHTVFTGDNYSIIKGEALAIRAYLHLDLLRLFGDMNKMEDIESGIPYLDSLSKQVALTMSPKNVITNIIADLAKAKSYLAVDPIKTGRAITTKEDNGYLLNRNYHLNYYAVVGLMARTYLYSGDKTNAFKCAQEVIEAQNEKLFPWSKTEDVQHVERALRDRTFSSEHLFALNMRKLNRHIKGYFVETSNPLTTRQEISSLFDATNDLRSIFYEVSSNVANVPSKLWQMDGIAYNGSIQTAKRDRMPMLKLSEMYYICAECNPSKAVDYINKVLIHRGYRDEELLASKTDVLLELEKEIKRENICEGQLFYFYKRTNIMPTDLVIRYVFPKPEVELEFGN